MTRRENPKISLVVPVYNEEASIDPFLKVARGVLRETASPSQIIFVDDGSTDATLQALRAAKRDHPEICIISLSRNFGKEAALTAGLDFAQGDVTIPMDVDLQDPPELIHSFLDHWRQGFDVVYGVRTRRDGDGFVKRVTAGWFYRVFNSLSRTSIPYNAGDYRLMDRRVVDEIKKLRERNRFMKGLMAWPGFRTIGVPFERQPRAAGATTWNYWKLWNFALDGLTSFSSAPLRLWIYLGSTVALISFLFAMQIVFMTLVYGNPVAGYPSVMVAVTFFGGIQLLTLGVIGEYIGRMFTELKARPIYIIDVVEE